MERAWKAFENVGYIKQQSGHENRAGHADQQEGRERKKLAKRVGGLECMQLGCGWNKPRWGL